MNKYYFEADSSDYEEFSIQPLGWAAELPEENGDNSAFEDRDIFESDYYLEYCITQSIGRPPSGSKFKQEHIESDYTEYGSSVYERLLYIYKPDKLRHIEYFRKLTRLLNSKRWSNKCRRAFEDEYQKFIEFKRKHPEEDYEF